MRTDDEILAVGEYVRTLVTNDTFNALFREFTDAMLNRIVGSDPHEVKAREFEYAQIRAMTGFSNHLVSLVESAEKIKQKNENALIDPDDMGEELED